MHNGLEVLKEIGAQKIHNETHISRDYVQSIIHGSFEGLNSVQFIGFVSILEREYNVDLSDLKERGREYFAEENAKSDEVKKVFVVPAKTKNNSKIYIWLGILIFLSVVYYTFGYLSSMEPTSEIIDNTKIEETYKNISDESATKETELVDDINETNIIVNAVTDAQDINITKIEAAVEPEPEAIEVVRTLKILPKNRIWAGYINIKTNQKHQQIFTKEVPLDTSRDWLLLFGAGTVKLEVNGEIKKYSSGQNMRFKYVDGEFTKITVREFKSLNKGRKW